MKIMILATKTPWPPVDGGRLLLLNTIEGLSRAGHEIVLVAPVDTRYFDITQVEKELRAYCRCCLVPAATNGIPTTLFGAGLHGKPLTVVRHSVDKVRRIVEDLLQREDFDLIHAEQQQAMVQVEAAADRGIPVILRAQNVESRLWAFASRYRSIFLRPFFLREERKLANWEGRSMQRASVTMALTKQDADALKKLGGDSAKVRVVPAPFKIRQAAGSRALDGEPSIVLLASNKWLPNRDAVWSFVADTWPRIQQILPLARLHVFGIEESLDRCMGVIWHPAPDSSSVAFPADSIVVIPARHPTGVPMKCLEAWSRGLAVVASPEAATQLEARDKREMLIADNAEGFARAMVLLYENPEMAHALIDGGYEALRKRHAPEIIIPAIEKIYREAIESRRE